MEKESKIVELFDDYSDVDAGYSKLYLKPETNGDISVHIENMDGEGNRITACYVMTEEETDTFYQELTLYRILGGLS